MSNVSDVTIVNYSGDYRVDSLLYESADWNFLLPTRTTLYYTFDLSYSSNRVSGVSGFNASQQAAVLAILAHASSVSGVSFAQTSSGSTADLHFANANLAGASTAGLCQSYEGWSYTSDNELTAYDAEAIVLLDNVEFVSINSTLTAGGSGYEVLLHEIGHALGLGHPFEGPYPLSDAQDNTNNTVMSYSDAGAYKSTYQSFDLLALAWIYGEDGLGGSYGYNSTFGPTLTASDSVNQTFTGGATNESFTGGTGNDTIDGGAGTDTAVFSGSLANYTVNKSGSSYTVQDNLGTDGTDTLSNVESLKFADKTVNLTIQSKAAAAPLADVQRLVELYVAFFNRVPDADGLEYWIGRYSTDMTVNQIAEAFYAAGVGASSVTGFSADMSNADFVNRIYTNVLGRADGADAEGLAYWSGALADGKESRGSLVTTILNVAHGFKQDATWHWVADLLDNKVSVASTFAISWGLNYNTPDESIGQGMAIAAAVTFDSTAEAINLIGVLATNMQLG